MPRIQSAVFLLTKNDTAIILKLDHGKKWFCLATKLETTNKFFVAATKNFASLTKRFVDRTVSILLL